MPRRSIASKPVKAMSWPAVVRCTRVGLTAPGSISDGLLAAIKAAPSRHRPLLQRKLGDLSAANPDDELAHHQSEFGALLSAEPIPEGVTAFYIGLTETMKVEPMSSTLRFSIAGATRCDEQAEPPVRAADLVWPRERSYAQLRVFTNFHPAAVVSDDPNFGADDPPANFEADEPYEDWASPLQIFGTVAAGRLLAHLLEAAPLDKVLGSRPKRTLVAGFNAGELFVYADLSKRGVIPRHVRRSTWLR